MAIELPTTALALQRRFWRRGQAMRSGEHNDDDQTGFRGLSAQMNHAYAYTWQVVASARRHDRGTMLDDTTGSYVACEPITVHLGADFAKLRLAADVFGGKVKLTTELGNAESAAIGARAVTEVDVTLSDATGIDCYVTVEIKADPTPGTCVLYGFVVYELVMVAGDF